MTDAATTVSFANDIRPYFVEYQANMRWRFDLTDCDQVSANAEQILNRIKEKSMPPPPFAPFPDAFIETFERWVKQGKAA